MSTIPYTILPAYGRTYQNAEQALADWNDGKDFKILFGPYLSIRDSERMIKDGRSTINLVWNVTDNSISQLEIQL